MVTITISVPANKKQAAINVIENAMLDSNEFGSNGWDIIDGEEDNTQLEKLVEDGTKQVGKGIAMDAIREALTGSTNLPPKGLLPTQDVKPWDRVGPRFTPLLVLSYAFNLTGMQATILTDRIRHALRHTTWLPLVIDAQSESKVQAFGVELPALETLSIDELIDMIEGLKCIKEAVHGVDAGSMSKS